MLKHNDYHESYFSTWWLYDFNAEVQISTNSKKSQKTKELTFVRNIKTDSFEKSGFT